MSGFKIRKAVIPVAGLGTRFFPATKTVPKEMIPIVDVPMIQYIVEEAVQSGIKDVILITAQNKEAIENYFDFHPELEECLEEKGRKDLAELSRSLAKLCNLIVVRQHQPLGLGHAVLCAACVVGNEPFAVLLGDDLIDAQVPCTRQLIDVFQEENASVVAVMEVSPKDVSKYGIVSGSMTQKHLMVVDDLIEKPAQGKAPSLLAIPGRYILSPMIFDYLKGLAPGRGGEIQLTDGLRLLAKNQRLLAYLFEGTRYDTGDRLGFIDATLAYALKRSEFILPVKEIMRRHLGDS